MQCISVGSAIMQAPRALVQESKGGGDGFEVQKYGDGRVALIGEPKLVPSPSCNSENDAGVRIHAGL